MTTKKVSELTQEENNKVRKMKFLILVLVSLACCYVSGDDEQPTGNYLVICVNLSILIYLFYLSFIKFR